VWADWAKAHGELPTMITFLAGFIVGLFVGMFLLMAVMVWIRIR
jgi:hypothetical protein